MSPFMGAILLFWFVVGHGGLFLSASAICGNASFQCDNGDAFDYPFIIIPGGEGGFGISGDYYFPLTGGYEKCGYSALSIECNAHGRPVLNISNNIYYILNNYPKDQYLRVVGADVYEEECPRPMHNFTLPTTSPFSNPYNKYVRGYKITYFYNCSSSSGYPKDVEQGLPCLDTNNTTPGLRSFAFPDYIVNRSADEQFKRYADERFIWFSRNCQESVVVPAPSPSSVLYPSDLKTSLNLGFDLDWSTPAECKACENSDGQCFYDETGLRACSCKHGSERRRFDKVCPVQTISQGATTNTSQSNGQINKSQSNGQIDISTQLKIILGVCSGIGGLLLVTLFVCRQKLSSIHKSTVSHWKSKIKSQTNVEAFLESCGCPGLQRYRYSEIKRMTNAFKEKLGQGGFGSVFKGMLPDGRLVAVKVLNESKGNGKDFINEVATIGGTNHVNVVSLLGFCSNGNKRALLYEFMPNGSLEKFIYNRENTNITNPPLGSERLYQIALGIARGLEYLHRGCKIRILHFDIKPHNILLDQDFCPKIADFGLAKLCQTRESIVSMHVARGTMGYIAPEVTCINFGGVSHKSDVYSYGMMILEMIGGRKNIDTTVENISEIYFPQWVYNHFIHDTNDMDGHNEILKEETIRKMIVVALHCIQTQPANRPSITKVVEMLEGNVDDLQMPPNPFQDPPRFSP